jgi:hypothetical protein
MGGTFQDRNVGVGVGSHTQGYEECKGGICGAKEEDGVVIDGLADLRSCDFADLYP